VTELERSSVLTKLEFPAIRERLAGLCRFSVSAERAHEIGPTGDAKTVAYLLDVTQEAVDLVTNFPDITIGGARDVRELAEKAEKGGRLQPGELLLVHDMVVAARSLRRSLFRLPEVESRFRNLHEFTTHVADMPELEADIGRSISPRGDVLDSASDELGRIRRAIRIHHSRLIERLNSLMTGKYSASVQDAIITTRDGRYVIPIKADSRSQATGVVHDTSASGQTLFMEPFEVVELNNKWREEQIAEQREIDRILDVLSAAVGDRGPALQRTVEAMAAIDLAMAKARLAFDLRATRPRLVTAKNTNPDGHPTHRVKLVRARHPLLDPATVVPIDIEIGHHYRALLITGPNTGGKTVALKTVGLLSLMAQSGLFIPADDTSELSVFPGVYVDIGDEQSIAQSLSTFSAHMRNVIAMLSAVTRDSLVLLDEMGAGTDPQEGSALARALITELLELGPLVIATTHYSEVKAYAYATAAVENASVEFDVRSLAPTYRLTIGVPGRSNAIAIARRLGMKRSVLDRASAMIDPNEVRADALLEDIRRRRDEAEVLLKRARTAEDEANQLRRKANQELRDAELERRSAREQALAEAQTELDEVRQTLRRLQRDRETGAATREQVEERRVEVEKAADVVRTFKRVQVPVRLLTPESRIRVGDRVQIIPLNQEGEVVGLDDDSAEVQLGSLKTRQPLEALTRLGRAKTESQGRTVVRAAPVGFIPMEIDLRGLRASEVEASLERYLEDAYRSGLPNVRIIHGKGTGALRQVVRDYLGGHPAVAKHVVAPANEGGDGATLAYFHAE
jgi:DNA mismatch repair protein MutS2